MWRVSILVAAGLCGSVQAQQLPDPTAPANTRFVAGPSVVTTDLTLQAIQQRDGERVAFISGQRVRQGDPLPPYQIKAITMNQVIVYDTKNNSELTLSLFAQPQLTNDERVTATDSGRN
ncbi:hypothetical protein CWI80_05265 [Pseudidiomarina sediminum]|uniref:MSHA biogenesis protein MshK n=1 Tax=Pseudidiomarina sediminum TaxID=431675 RepID=A0A432Z9W6_9GAMM|nr:hypothetical protein [Pseudidiomarina sediminum]MBY6063946.1 hypothetical protein [Pseudidiomarina sediminum]RUO74747.1 hypothetical protein CWI80_05265 [Pseudidiomarina sediminum]